MFPFKMIFFIMLASLCSCAIMNRQCGNISYVRAVEIAGGEASRLGYDIKSMELKEISKHYREWNRFLPKKSESKYILERRDKLKGKNYWAVYYTKERKPGQNIKGGDICIFIDASTGEILTTYRGK